MVLVAWVRRTIALDAAGQFNRGLFPSAWQRAAEGGDREDLELHCRTHFPGWEYVVLRSGEAPVFRTGKGG